jgi:hypothetical protein
MRWIIGLTFAAFLGILGVAWCAAERAHPVFIDVDPAAAAAKHH